MTGEWSGTELEALREFLEERRLSAGPLTATRIGDGHSNLTHRVSDGTSQVIVRRPPPPPVPPGAHDVLREARLVEALAGTGVPVPQVLATARAGEVIDSPFVVTTYIEGPVVTTATPPALATAGDRRATGESLVDTLAALHAVDWRAAGLADMGRPEGFNARHLRRMRRLVADDTGRPPEGFGTIDTWLEANCQPSPGRRSSTTTTTGSAMSCSGSGRPAGSSPSWTGSSPRSATRCSTSATSWRPTRLRGSPLTPTAALGSAVLEQGYPTRAELAARYAATRGLVLPDLTWCTALALWKLAVLFECSHRRAVAGNGDPYYRDPALVTSFLDAAHRAAGLGPA